MKPSNVLSIANKMIKVHNGFRKKMSAFYIFIKTHQDAVIY